MASVTSSVRLSTGILIAPLRPAPLLAKMVATLDTLSGGRVELGVGTGWQEVEFSSQGLDFAKRGRLLTDTVAACQALWGPSPASFESESMSFEDLWCEPKPAQAGGPPVLFSGTLTERNIGRIVSMGAGWIPIMTAGLDDLAAGVELLGDRFVTAGRDRSELRSRGRLGLAADADGRPDLAATLERAADFADAGATDVSIRMTDFVSTHDDAGAFFDRLAPLLAT